MQDEEQAIVAALNAYEAALNHSDVDAVAKLYTADAVLMAPENRPVVGLQAVRTAYQGIFANIALNIKFEVGEVRQLAKDWAFLRSTSSGTITIKANGASVPEGNQELFIFQKIDGTWKIARYAFSVTRASGGG